MTRQITKEATEKFLNGENFSKSNTQVKNTAAECSMYLFGNKIATRCGNRISVSLAGWNTPTTRERLSLIAKIKQKNFTPYITLKNGEEVEMETTGFYRVK